MKKPVKSSDPALPLPGGHDKVFASNYPLLWEYLSTDRWDDGTTRQTTTAFFFVESGRWKLMLKDRALGAVAFVAGATVEDCWLSAEVALSEGKLDWRPDRPSGGGRGRR